MNLKFYLERINYTASLEPNHQTLCALQEAHLSAIPYENLDIHLGRRLELNETRAYQNSFLKSAAVGALR